MKKHWWGVAAAVAVAFSPGVADAGFSLTIVSAPVGYTGPGGAGPDPGNPNRIIYDSGTSVFAGEGVLFITTINGQNPVFASIGTTVGINQGSEVPAGRYIIRILRDDFTLPPGDTGIVSVEHTSIVPYFGTPASPLVTTTASTQIVGGETVSVNGSPMMTQLFEKFTTKPPGAYTMIQTIVIDLPLGGSGGFGVNSTLTLVPAPSALLLGAIGLPLLAALGRLRRKPDATAGADAPPVAA